MEVNYFSDVNEFYNSVFPFLITHEAENNLLFGILNALKQDIHTYSPDVSPRLIIISENAKIELVSLRTPPYNQVISYTDNLETVSILVDTLVHKDSDIPGIFGFKEGATEFVKLWQERRTTDVSLEMHERFHRLIRVNPSAIGSHSLEIATQQEYKLISEWNNEFLKEALPNSSASEIASNQTRLKQLIQQQSIFLLKAGNQILSMARKSGETPNGQIISGVYTPSDKRKRGYGTEVVAKLSQLALNEGKKFCFLSTDLANPTSNKIYYNIGYRPVIDIDVWRFHNI